MRKIGEFQVESQIKLVLGPGEELRQTFEVSRGGLAGVRLLVFNPVLGGEGRYEVVLMDEEGATLVRQEVTEGNMSWDEWLRIDFASLGAVEGQKLTIVMRHLGEEEDGLARWLNLYRLGRVGEVEINGVMTAEEMDGVEKSYVGVGYTDADNYVDGEASLDGEALAGDVAFQVYYAQRPVEFVTSSVVDAVGRWRSDGGFFVGYWGLLAVLVLVTGWRVWVVGKGKKGKRS